MHRKRNRHHPVLHALDDRLVRHRSLGPAVVVELVLLRVNGFDGDKGGMRGLVFRWPEGNSFQLPVSFP